MFIPIMILFKKYKYLYKHSRNISKSVSIFLWLAKFYVEDPESIYFTLMAVAKFDICFLWHWIWITQAYICRVCDLFIIYI
jgi:hypothetical protein